MRVLLGAARVGDVPATRALAALRRGWLAGNPEAEVVGVVCSDAGHDLLDAIESARGGERVVVPVLDRDGARSLPALILLVDGTAYVQAVDVLGSVIDPDGASDVPDVSRDESGVSRDGPDAVARRTSFGVGQLVLAAAATGARRVVVGCGDAELLDLGVGFLAALGGLDAGALASGALDAGAREAGAPGVPGTAVGSDALDEIVTDARAALVGTELVLAAASDRTARGLRGAASALGGLVGQETAAAWDAALAPTERTLADAAARSRRPDLLAGEGVAPRASAVPGSGAGGGLGLAVLALGGRVVSGAAFVAAETGLAGRAGEIDLAVSLSDRVDPLEADRGVLGAVSAVARAQGAAALALGRTGTLDRRAGAPHGVSAAASVPGDEDGIEAAGRRQGAAWRW
ncbi:glycerate kinase [Salana multivorans]|uniref:Glycerate kinase n=1 Tax=Salana multivorans TaxID=120377 RepID=A0A3N2D1R4_9MICO|nr:glycerate kinase [Salana multivorans]ROR93712.1 glycerate kinase [Salana multivorans]